MLTQQWEKVFTHGPGDTAGFIRIHSCGELLQSNTHLQILIFFFFFKCVPFFLLWLQFVLLSWTLNDRKTWVVSGEGVRGVTSTKARKHGHFNFLPLLSSFSFCHHRLKLDLLGEDRFSGNKSHLIRPKLATTIQALCAPTGINQAPKHLPPRADVRELSFPCYPQIPQQPGGVTPPSPLTRPREKLFFSPRGYCFQLLNGLPSNSSQHV